MADAGRHFLIPAYQAYQVPGQLNDTSDWREAMTQIISDDTLIGLNASTAYWQELVALPKIVVAPARSRSRSSMDIISCRPED